MYLCTFVCVVCVLYVKLSICEVCVQSQINREPARVRYIANLMYYCEVRGVSETEMKFYLLLPSCIGYANVWLGGC